jgi:hypothetical protein
MIPLRVWQWMGRDVGDDVAGLGAVESLCGRVGVSARILQRRWSAGAPDNANEKTPIQSMRYWISCHSLL